MDRVLDRIDHILAAIEDLRTLMANRSEAALDQDRFVRAAFERFVEIISEASRHIPDDLTATEPTIPWRQIADTGNHIRHGYERTNSRILWDIYQ
jgi:uncharacterized protein with HEPN domain